MGEAVQGETGAEMLGRLRADGVVTGSDASMEPLKGGVSSDIWLVRDGVRRLVVKRALAKLRVEAEWYADTSRNGVEQAYMRYVAGFEAEAVPRIIASGDGYFAMEHLGAGFEVWKAALLRGEVDFGVAERAGALLGRIHACSMGDPDAAERFATDANFFELRIEPYLLATAAAHPRHRAAFEAEAGRLASRREALVHGDYSPKNMMVGCGRFVVLDCEVAWFGDPAFDVAFCLTHLLLKGLHHGPSHESFRRASRRFLGAYGSACVGDGGLGERVGLLLRMLLLARVDGKSPVEYLDEPKREQVRRWADGIGFVEGMDVSIVIEAWFSGLGVREGEGS